MTREIQTLHRAVRLLLESTEERDVHAGAKKLGALRFQVVLGSSVAESPVLQAAALTAVNAGHRTFLGGVEVIGAHGLCVRTPLATEADLGAAVLAIGGRLAVSPRPDLPTLVIGADAAWRRTVPTALRIQVEDWKAAVSPASEACLNDVSCVAPVGVFAAALGVSELLGAALHLHPDSARRTLGLSLWRPDAIENWRNAPAGPDPVALPSSLWLIGLGHLGQAYAWSLASLGYPAPATLEILLQDDERVALENLSTCLLTQEGTIGRRKTRVVADWLEARHFGTRVIERRFRPIDRFTADDPALGLVGVDSSAARAEIAAALRHAPQMRLLDVGLGPSPLDFDEMVLHASPFTDADILRWKAASHREEIRVDALAQTDRFREIRRTSELDACGIVQLAGQAVGVPYVGAAAGALLVSELLRRLAGEAPIRAMALRLRDLAFRFSPSSHAPVAGPLAFVSAKEVAGAE